MKVAIQGELGSFSHEAASRMLPKAQVVCFGMSRDVFEATESGECDAAVIPIENSLAGPVAEHYDLLLASKLFVSREYRLRIEHNLIAAPGVKISDVRRIFSHPIALAQCRTLFQKNKKLTPTPYYDTAGSAKFIVAENLKDSAAIAGAPAAKQYGGNILLKNIEDNKQNYTRFLYMSRDNTVPRKADKTTIALSLKNAPGALFKALSVFALRDIDLSKIESRPIPGRPWEYVFYVDLMQGDNQRCRSALAHLGEFAEFVKVLGVYSAYREPKR